MATKKKMTLEKVIAATSPRYRYKLDVVIKSTNKKEMLEELKELIETVKIGGSLNYGGDSGTCYVDCAGISR